MKKILFVTILSLIFVTKTFAGNDDEFVSLQAGFLFNNTLNASFGYEKELRYDNAYEIFGDMGCSLKRGSHTWGEEHYYWGGSIVYKKSLVRWRNATLRLNIGPFAGAYRGDFFLAAEGSFEYNYTCYNGWKLMVKQKNNVFFLHGDTFLNGIQIDLKIPL